MHPGQGLPLRRGVPPASLGGPGQGDPESACARVRECARARKPGSPAAPAPPPPSRGAAAGRDGHPAGTTGLHALTPTRPRPPRRRFPASLPGPGARPREAQSRRIKFKAAPHRAAGFVRGGRGRGETQGEPRVSAALQSGTLPILLGSQDTRRESWPSLPRSCLRLPVGVAAPVSVRPRPLPTWAVGTGRGAPPPAPARRASAPSRPQRSVPPQLLPPAPPRPHPRAPAVGGTGPVARTRQRRGRGARRALSPAPAPRPAGGPCPRLRPRRAPRPGDEERRGA